MQLHPALQTLLASALMLWPLMRVYKRVGLSPLWALLIFTSLLIPFSGLLLVLMPFTFKAWPHFPKAPPPRAPVKTAI